MAAGNANITAVIVAAGSGQRYGSRLPKQFCPLAGRPVLMHTVTAMRRALPGARVVLVLSPAMTDYWRELCRSHNFDSPEVVTGGATRWESVSNAVTACAPYAPGSIVLVHDGARPVVPAGVVRGVVDGARNHGAAIPAVPVTDSLRHLNADGTSQPVDRAQFRAVQTPQGFDAALLLRAYRLPYSPAFTDDASVVAAAGSSVVIVPGSPLNIKITNPGDIDVAALYLNMEEPR